MPFHAETAQCKESILIRVRGSGVDFWETTWLFRDSDFLLGKMKRLEYMNSAAYFTILLEISTDYEGDIRNETVHEQETFSKEFPFQKYSCSRYN